MSGAMVTQEHVARLEQQRAQWAARAEELRRELAQAEALALKHQGAVEFAGDMVRLAQAEAEAAEKG